MRYLVSIMHYYSLAARCDGTSIYHGNINKTDSRQSEISRTSPLPEARTVPHPGHSQAVKAKI